LLQRITTFFCYDPKKLKEIFDGMRNKGKYLDTCGPYKIKYVRDLTIGFDSSQPDNKPILPVSTSAEMITFYFENGCVATLRGSGTEPKLKYYVELSGTDRVHVITTLADIVNHIIDTCLKPEFYGLKRPVE